MKRNVIKLTAVGLLTLVLLALPLMAACAKPEEAPTAPAASPPAPKVYKLRMITHLARGSDGFRIQGEWVDSVRRASGGRLDIELSAGGEVVPILEMFEACSNGIVDIVDSDGGFWEGKIPAGALSSGLFFTLRDFADYKAVLHHRGLEDVIRKAYAEHNVYLVRVMPCLSYALQTEMPITDLSDLQGRKIRALGMKGEVLGEAGASCVFFPGPEIYGALERGAIDGAVYGSITTHYEMGFHEVAKHIMPLGVGAAELVMNMDTWNSLPDDLKEIINLSAAHYNDAYIGKYRDNEAWMRKDMKENWGVVEHQLPAEEQFVVTEAALRIMDKYSEKDPYFAEGAEIMKTYLKDIGLVK